MKEEGLSPLQKAKEFLFKRQSFYQGLFKKESLASQEVLKDLSQFCRADDTTFHENQKVNDAYQGRREVWLRICHHLNLDSGDLWKKYGKGE